MFVLEGFLYDIPLHDLMISRDRVAPLEQRMAALGFTLVLLTVPPDRIEEQCVVSTREHRGPGWAAHLSRLGTTDAERAAALASAQHRLRDWAGTSPLPVTELDTSAHTWTRAADAVVSLLRGRTP